ncbi:hypothetical protein ACIBL6_26725 [Streptomyces sp. NPDC050400]|uniref:hypothetical protein n=1 Tax=Streptomyces sp. NPDC050400 TaxID=3365610 RepID=UPI0037A1AB03
MPSQGFHLTPVVQASATSELLTHVRRFLLLTLPVGVGAVLALQGAPVAAIVLAAVFAAWAVCYLDRMLGYIRMRTRHWEKRRPLRRRWWVSPRRSSRLRAEPDLRNGLVVPYALRLRDGQEPVHHFIGAGPIARDSSIGIDVAPSLSAEELEHETEEERLVRQAFRSVADLTGAGPRDGKGVIPFTPDELHSYVSQQLKSPFQPKPRFHPDNRLDVFDVAAISAERWSRIDKAKWQALLALAQKGADDAGATTEAKKARRFLCVRIRSWDGELVASLYVAFAYEHHFLRVVIRPQVLFPVHPTLRKAGRAVERGGWGWYWRTAVNALIDIPYLAHQAVTPLRRHFVWRDLAAVWVGDCWTC